MLEAIEYDKKIQFQIMHTTTTSFCICHEMQ